MYQQQITTFRREADLEAAMWLNVVAAKLNVVAAEQLAKPQKRKLKLATARDVVSLTSYLDSQNGGQES